LLKINLLPNAYEKIDRKMPILLRSLWKLPNLSDLSNLSRLPLLRAGFYKAEKRPAFWLSHLSLAAVGDRP
jgi:hypothetical protein